MMNKESEAICTNYMKDNKLNSADKETRKLTMLLDTCGTFMTIILHIWRNMVTDNTITRFINKIKEEYPLYRPIAMENDLKDYSFPSFVKRIRANEGLRQEASSIIDSRLFKQPNYGKNIIQAIIRKLNEHDFVFELFFVFLNIFYFFSKVAP